MNDGSANSSSPALAPANPLRLHVMVCPECSAYFGVSPVLVVEADGRPVYCPNGHGHPLACVDARSLSEALRNALGDLATSARELAAIRAELARRPDPASAPAATEHGEEEITRRCRVLFVRAEEVTLIGKAKRRCRFCGKAISAEGIAFRRHLKARHRTAIAAMPAAYFD